MDFTDERVTYTIEDAVQEAYTELKNATLGEVYGPADHGSLSDAMSNILGPKAAYAFATGGNPLLTVYDSVAIALRAGMILQLRRNLVPEILLGEVREYLEEGTPHA